MQQQPLDILGPNDGFRLDHAEIFNWGTFDKRVWTIVANGETTLMTGDIGSGKSSAGDALQTLLVPPRRVAYNKAADEAARERSVYSYVRGQYSNNIDEETKKAKPVFLRGIDTYSTILAVFRNKNLREVVTLAQVLWVRNEGESPHRLYIVAEKKLEIESHFTGFETISELKRRFEPDQSIHLHDSFEKYSKHFSRLMGIPGDQALSLFCHTMSMKQVPNLTTFIRDFMLDEGKTPQVIQDVIDGFDSLTEAHEAVEKAQKKIELLKPVDEEANKFEEYLKTHERRRVMRDGVRPYYASLNIGLIETRISEIEADNIRAEAKQESIIKELSDLKASAEEIRNSINDAGGGRITVIETEIEKLTVTKGLKKKAFDDFAKDCASIGIVPPQNEDDFEEVSVTAGQIVLDLDKMKADAENARIDYTIDSRKLEDEKIAEIDEELTSLRSRRTSIPNRNLSIRLGMANAVGVDIERLPFVGELIEVREGEGAWEGAVERILHNFALSILVPEDLYRQVSTYVDKTHLGGRVVFFKVPKLHTLVSRKLVENSLVTKLNIKPASEFKSWLTDQLSRRFDMVCCESFAEFRNYTEAVMKSGLFKTKGDRHEKDDRRHIGDRSTYVLGWNNQKKIDALDQTLKGLREELVNIKRCITKIIAEENDIVRKIDLAKAMLTIKSFEQIDWQSIVRQIDKLREEKRRIEESSDRLRQLREELDTTKREIERVEDERIKVVGNISSNNTKIENYRDNELPKMVEELDAIEESCRTDLFAEIAKEIQRWEEGRRPVAVNTAMSIATKLTARLEDYRRSAETSANESQRRLHTGIRKYRDEFPIDAQDVDIDVRSVPELRGILREIESEGLPKHRERFRELLREHTIQGLVNLEQSLDREKKNIETRLEQINRSLGRIDYVKGTFIEIVLKQVADPEIRQFQADLKACFADTLDEKSLYTEAKFLQVKQIVERLKNRGGDFATIDKDWRDKVTDVRQWFDFMAHEKFRETGVVKCVYEGSSGRSGGQKEKLAYTILASALAYQFGADRERSFRFVIVDEAFGRGSEESARFGMELFGMLNLQLLVLTPLQKINVIEKYISSVNFVHNNAEGSCSVLRNMTLEELQRERLDKELVRQVS